MRSRRATRFVAGSIMAASPGLSPHDRSHGYVVPAARKDPGAHSVATTRTRAGSIRRTTSPGNDPEGAAREGQGRREARDPDGTRSQVAVVRVDAVHTAAARVGDPERPSTFGDKGIT